MFNIVSQLCSSEHSPTSFINGMDDSTPLDSMPGVETRITDLSFLDDHIPFAFAAGTASNPDTLSQRDMLKAHDKDEFIQCQPDEINGLHEANVFDYMKLDDIPPKRRRKLLNATWSYRRKRRPDGSLLKHKCRICADGSQQEHGVDFWDTHSPVVQWSSVRSMLILSAVLGFASRQVDFVQAFPQAPLEDDVYMRIPQGFAFDPSTGRLVQSDDPKHKDTKHCIKLKRNLYGCKQASRNWFLHLSQGLQAKGFVPSKTDPCLFIRNDAIICLHTDDCCVFAKNDKIIDDLIATLSDEFLLKDKGNIEDFLGVHIENVQTKHGHEIHLQQLGLINDVLNELGISGPSAKHEKHDTPMKEVLRPDPDGKPFSFKWSHRSIIGKLNFLAQNTRPDIAYAVHQCAKYSANPKHSHGIALKRIGRHLNTTRDKGLILRPDGSHQLHAHSDSDFAGNWTAKFAHLCDSQLSRAGCVITHSGC